MIDDIRLCPLFPVAPLLPGVVLREAVTTANRLANGERGLGGTLAK